MLLFRDMVEQLSTLTKLCNQETNSVGLPSLEQLNDVWMIQWSQDADLVLKGLVVSDSRLLHGFDSNFLPYKIISLHIVTYQTIYF